MGGQPVRFSLNLPNRNTTDCNFPPQRMHGVLPREDLGGDPHTYQLCFCVDIQVCAAPARPQQIFDWSAARSTSSRWRLATQISGNAPQLSRAATPRSRCTSLSVAGRSTYVLRRCAFLRHFDAHKYSFRTRLPHVYSPRWSHPMPTPFPLSCMCLSPTGSMCVVFVRYSFYD